MKKLVKKQTNNTQESAKPYKIIHSEAAKLSVNEVAYIDMRGLNLQQFRSAIASAERTSGKKFKTKASKERPGYRVVVRVK